METINIILAIAGGIGITVGGYWLAFGGALGNATGIYLLGMGVYLFGVFTTSMTIFVNVFGADPTTNGGIYFLSAGIAGFIGVAHWRKIFGRG